MIAETMIKQSQAKAKQGQQNIIFKQQFLRLLKSGIKWFGLPEELERG